ncbi:DUF6461 domain-containing protein [Kribbella sp. NPDC056345]|uniref:DUF6461 domain-containing protein n=1 Tax=Kribbella sp. NPDC056345 TaxID=3345789 RepID=UPI0035E10A32
MASPEDYAWTQRGHAPYFCVSMLRGITADELLDRLAAQERGGPMTLPEAVERSFAVESSSGTALSAARTLDEGWTLWVEPNGFAAAWAGALSAGSRLVVIEENPKGGGNFCWYEDGELKLRFEPAFACERDGSDPDSLYDEMERLGLEVVDSGDDYDIGPVHEAAYALMEHLTEVRLTPEHFAGTFVTGLVKLP